MSPASVQPEAVLDSSAVPAPRKKASGEPGAGKRTRAKRAADAQDRAAVKKATSKKAAAGRKPASKSGAAKAAQSTLVELVRHHLTEQSEPRSAAEVTTALDKAHPERGIKTTVVRTTLEGLVAKNQAQRTKQGSSVYYTAAEQTSTPVQDEQQSEQAE
ncbi:hypothetical protein [Streptomyces sp. JNUCC 63]